MSFFSKKQRQTIERVTDDEFKDYVGLNAYKFMPVRERLKEGRSGFSFNLAAFLLGPFWAAYRKIWWWFCLYLLAYVFLVSTNNGLFFLVFWLFGSLTMTSNYVIAASSNIASLKKRETDVSRLKELLSKRGGTSKLNVLLALVIWALASLLALSFLGTSDTQSSRYSSIDIGSELKLAVLKNSREFNSRFGEVSIKGDWGQEDVLLDGRSAYKPEDAMSVHFERAFTLGEDDLLLLAESSGGSACPVLYRIAVISSHAGMAVLPAFGTCSDLIVDIKIEKNTVKFSMPGFVGPYESEESIEIAGNMNVVFTISKNKDGGYTVSEKVVPASTPKTAVDASITEAKKAEKSLDNSPPIVVPNPFGQKLITSVDAVVSCINKNTKLAAKFERSAFGNDQIKVESATMGSPMTIVLKRMDGDLAKKFYSLQDSKVYMITAIGLANEYSENSVDIFRMFLGLTESSCPE